MNRCCTLCNTDKPIKEFAIKKSYHDGLSPWCKPCKKSKDKESYEKSKAKRIAKSKEYYKANKSTILERRKNDENVKEYNERYKEENREYIRQYQKIYNSENKEKIQEWRSLYNKAHRKEINEYSKERRKNPIHKTAKKVRARLRDFLNNKGLRKSKHFDEYIGCSKEELVQHLESKFQPGMTWENHGTVWHIDHSISLASANSEERIYELCHYKNLKPMFAEENIAKNSRSDMCWQKLRRDILVEEDKKAGFCFDLKASQFELAHEQYSQEHTKFIERYEWLGEVGFGVRWVFTARHEGKLAGVVMISEPNGYQFGIELEALIQRGACSSWAPKNLNSRLVMFACNWVARNTTKRIFVAYSDPTAGEIGTIYQACNFDYLGNDFGSKINYKLENGRYVNARYFTRTSSMKKWAKELNIEWQKEWTKENGFQDSKAIPEKIKTILRQYALNKQESCEKIHKESKGKYALLINVGKERLEKPWKAKPYPKRF